MNLEIYWMCVEGMVLEKLKNLNEFRDLLDVCRRNGSSKT
jgi:hypothetical protein